MTTREMLKTAKDLLAQVARNEAANLHEAIRFAKYIGHSEPNINCSATVRAARAREERARTLALAAHDAWMEAR